MKPNFRRHRKAQNSPKKKMVPEWIRNVLEMTACFIKVLPCNQKPQFKMSG